MFRVWPFLAVFGRFFGRFDRFWPFLDVFARFGPFLPTVKCL
jgi:hypothetical protein